MSVNYVIINSIPVKSHRHLMVKRCQVRPFCVKSVCLSFQGFLLQTKSTQTSLTGDTKMCVLWCDATDRCMNEWISFNMNMISSPGNSGLTILDKRDWGFVMIHFCRQPRDPCSTSCLYTGFHAWKDLFYVLMKLGLHISAICANI